MERFLDKGYELRIYDRNVRFASIVGANQDYILIRIPSISKLMVDSMDKVQVFGETLVIGNDAEEFRTVSERLRPGRVVVDLVRISTSRIDGGQYDGIC